MMKFVLKILILSMMTSLLVAGCGGSEESTDAPVAGASGDPAPGAVSPGAAALGHSAAQKNGSSNDSPVPPGDVPKEQEVAKEQAEAGKQ